MRRVGIPLGLALVLALLPGALAGDPVTVEAPDLRAHVGGAQVVADTGDHTPVGVEGSVRTEDVTLGTKGTRCTVDPDGPRARDPCTLSLGPSPDLVDYRLRFRLGGAPPVPAQDGGADVAPQEAHVAEAPASHAVLVAAAAAGASLVALYGAWRVLRWTGLLALLPLYTHIRDDEILDDPNRRAIHRLIVAEPGISTKDVADRLGLAWGTVTHHLTKLEKRRFVTSKKYGKYRRFFANGAGGTERKDAVAVLRLDRTGDIAALIRQNPGVSQKAVGDALGVSSSTILWHIKRLERAHLITKVRDGKLVRYYPGEGLDSLAPAPAPRAPLPGSV